MNLMDEVYEEAVLAVIEAVEAEKRMARVVPGYALDVEVRARMPGKDKEVREALRRLWKSKRIAAGRTLNHIWIKTKN